MKKILIPAIIMLIIIVMIISVWECIKIKIKKDSPYLGKNPKIIFHRIEFLDWTTPVIEFGGIPDKDLNEISTTSGLFYITHWETEFGASS